MNNNSDRHINEEKLKLNRAKYIRDRLEDQYEITPTNSILISLIEYNKVIVEIKKYLSHISPYYRRHNLDFEADSVYMVF
tara:strand:- start:8264 stop:8503 length:240 start_codon:yes stop_codon:yes gene_type:complete